MKLYFWLELLLLIWLFLKWLILIVTDLNERGPLLSGELRRHARTAILRQFSKVTQRSKTKVKFKNLRLFVPRYLCPLSRKVKFIFRFINRTMSTILITIWNTLYVNQSQYGGCYFRLLRKPIIHLKYTKIEICESF